MCKELFDYFEQNWARSPYPVIDHSIRIYKELDGSFTFYIHPLNTDGITTDFVVTEKEIKQRIF